MRDDVRQAHLQWGLGACVYAAASSAAVDMMRAAGGSTPPCSHTPTAYPPASPGLRLSPSSRARAQHEFSPPPVEGGRAGRQAAPAGVQRWGVRRAVALCTLQLAEPASTVSCRSRRSLRTLELRSVQRPGLAGSGRPRCGCRGHQRQEPRADSVVEGGGKARLPPSQHCPPRPCRAQLHQHRLLRLRSQKPPYFCSAYWRCRPPNASSAKRRLGWGRGELPAPPHFPRPALLRRADPRSAPADLPTCRAGRRRRLCCCPASRPAAAAVGAPHSGGRSHA